MYKFIKHELSLWLKSPMIWVFLGIIFLLSFLSSSLEDVKIVMSSNNVHKNAPTSVQLLYTVFSMMGLLMTASFMNGTAMRDFDSGMYQFVFSSPIKKSNYFFGRFIGAVLAASLPFLGVSLGVILGGFLGPIFDWCPADKYGDIYWTAHLKGFLIFTVPNVLIGGVWLYALALYFRNNMISYIAAMAILVLITISGGFTENLSQQWLSVLLDPFGGKALADSSKYFSAVEQNSLSVGLEPYILLNRVVWLTLGFVGLWLIYHKFSFTVSNKTSKTSKERSHELPPKAIYIAKNSSSSANQFSWASFVSMLKFEFKNTIKNPSFISLTALAVVVILIRLVGSGESYDTAKYPVTYAVLDTINDSFYMTMMGFICFYSGVLVWRDREHKINEINDASPMHKLQSLWSKFAALALAVALLHVLGIFIGLISQISQNYDKLELGVYLKYTFLISYPKYLVYIALALCVQLLMSNRYMAYFVFVLIVLMGDFLWKSLEISSNLVIFAGIPKPMYSDMNGFGDSLASSTWFSIYWLLVAVLLLYIGLAFEQRGVEKTFKTRLNSAKNIFKQQKSALGILGVFLLGTASYIYYNTKILNGDEMNEAETETYALNYEKKYKKYQHSPQLTYSTLTYHVDLKPEENSVEVKLEAWLKNASTKEINELHFNSLGVDDFDFETKDAKISLHDKDLDYYILKTNKSLKPNDSIKITFNSKIAPQGFSNTGEPKTVFGNGAFISNDTFTPYIGYNPDREISDKEQRKKLKLAEKPEEIPLDDNNLKARMQNLFTPGSHWVHSNTIISTSPDQTAVAPGSLIKSWQDKGRKYFHYKLDHATLSFYSFVSGRYQVQRQKVKGIDFEVYHDPKHGVNAPTMIKSMQKSLDYYQKNFGPYPHKQCRIIEFPRYSAFAQSFPGTMPYSEGMGFIDDLRNVKKDNIDFVFYVVAHEMAHQYWGHQLVGAHMQGTQMLSETFAQYSALMVMEKEYGQAKMHQFLKYEMYRYLTGRALDSDKEMPLMKASAQHLYYNKGSVAMYYLKEMMGEEKLNQALRNLLKTYAYKAAPYPTSVAAIKAFKQELPADLQHVVKDLFEDITLFSNRMLSAEATKIGNEYQVTLKFSVEKTKADGLGNEKPAPLNDYIDVAIFDEESDGDFGKVLIYKRIKINKKDNTCRFITKTKPYKAGVDPYHYLIDRLGDDNIKKIDVK